MAKKNPVLGILVMVFWLITGLLLTGCKTPTDDDSGDSGSSGGTSSPTALSANSWQDGSITKEGQIKEYTVSVTSGTIYFIWWNDRHSGDGTKTSDIRVSARHSNGNSLFTSTDSAWSTPRYFTAESSGTVTLTVSGSVGTYEMRYTTATPPGTVRLYEDEWETGTLFISEQIDRYTISVTTGTIYFIWWNDRHSGDGTKTSDIYVSARHSNGDSLFTNVDTAWSTPRYFTAESSGTVTLTVSGSVGTYEMRYTTATPPGTVELTEGIWKDGTLFIPEQRDEYTFYVGNGIMYYVWWNDHHSGDSTKTSDIYVSARHSNGDSLFTNVDTAWSTPRSFTATSNGTVTLTVSGSVGTYAITYKTFNDSRP